MLIINADDFGATAGPTDAAVEMIDAGVVSSTTAMVCMRDTERAARIARERGLAIGLHLNLTFPYSDQAVPMADRERQLRLTEVLDRESWMNPPRRLHRLGVAEVVRFQLERFRSQFGEPTHIDGHHHVHIHPDVLEQLPGIPIRPPLTTPDGFLHSGPAKLPTAGTRFTSPDLCVDFETLRCKPDAVIEAVVRYARAHSVEVMTHPQHEVQRTVLLSEHWGELIHSVPIGTYRELDAPRGAR